MSSFLQQLDTYNGELQTRLALKLVTLTQFNNREQPLADVGR